MPKRRTELSPSPSHGGAFTRSRSELFLHRTRSGLARPDPARVRHNLLLRRLSTTSPPPIHGGNLVKDLRLRRVFSPASVSVDEEASPDRTGKIGSRDDTVGQERGKVGVDEISKSSHGSNGFDNSSNESSAPESVVAVDSIDLLKNGSSTLQECVVAVDCTMKSRDSKDDDAKLDVIDPPENTKSTPPQCVVAVDLGMANMDRLMKDSQNDIIDGVKLNPFNPSQKKLAIRALISSGAGSTSTGPCKLFLLIKCPCTFNLPLHFLPKREFRYTKKVVPFRLHIKCKAKDKAMNDHHYNPISSSCCMSESAQTEDLWFQCRYAVKGLACKAPTEC